MSTVCLTLTVNKYPNDNRYYSVFYINKYTIYFRNKDEPSAYSVFNPNCESIDGTLTAEQFENEIRHKNMK